MRRVATVADALLELWFAGPWLLLLLPLAGRLIPRGAQLGERAWSWRLDPALSLALGLGIALLSTAVLVRPSTWFFPLSAADFEHYCGLVARCAAGELDGYEGVRMVAPAWLPSSLMPWLTLLDAMAVQSVLALAACGSALYLWGLAVHGRTAGIAAAIAMGAVGPVAFLGRDLSFYPVMVGCSAVLAAGTAAMLRFRGWAPALLAGVGGATLLLSDVRGMLFAAPLLALAFVACPLRARSAKQAALRLLVLATPLVASWVLAHATVPAATVGLERQAYMYAEQAVRDVGGAADWLGDEAPEQGFLWGHDTPLAVPGALWRLQSLSRSVPAAVVEHWDGERIWTRQVWPWAVPACLAALICLAGLARRPGRLAALLLTLAPFAALLAAALRVLPQDRHLSLCYVGLPLLLGVAVAILAEGSPPEVEAESPEQLPWRRLVLAAFLTSALVGVPPSWLAHRAAWRHEMVQAEPRTILGRVAREGAVESEPCSALLREQWREHPHWPSRLFPRAGRIVGDDAAH